MRTARIVPIILPLLGLAVAGCGKTGDLGSDPDYPYFDGHYESFPGELAFPAGSDGIGDPTVPGEAEPPDVGSDDPDAPLTEDALPPLAAGEPAEDLGEEPLADDLPESAPALDDDAQASLAALGALSRDAYGGVVGSGLTTHATGFFHVEHPSGAQRSWLVDPAGNPYFGVGVNTVLRSANAPKIARYLQRYHGDLRRAANVEWDRLSTGTHGGYGYRFNNVGGFSDIDDLHAGARNPIVDLAPYSIVLDVDPGSTSYALRSASGHVLGATRGEGHEIADPYNPRFIADLSLRFASKARPADANLIAYYLGNELGLFDNPLHGHAGVHDFRRWIWSQCPSGSTPAAPMCAPHALEQLLTSRYRDVASLNAAWGTSHASFDAVIAQKPVPGTSECNAACGDDLQRFAHAMLGEWVRATTTTLRAVDPVHVVASPRFHVASELAYCFWGTASCTEHLVETGDAVPADHGDVMWTPYDLFARHGDVGFDLVALNAYPHRDTMAWTRPWMTEGVHAVTSTGVPVIISEFGVRARLHGWSNSGGAGSFVPGTGGEAQRNRAAYYEACLVQMIGYRDVVGVSFHRWADRYKPGDTQMNMGIVHRNGARWSGFDDGVRHVNAGIYGRIWAATRF